MRSYWYQNFEDLTIHVTVATDAKFWGLKFQKRFIHAKLRGRDLVFWYCPIIRTCTLTWTGQNKISPTPYKIPVLFRPRANRKKLNNETPSNQDFLNLGYQFWYGLHTYRCTELIWEIKKPYSCSEICRALSQSKYVKFSNMWVRLESN